MNATWGGTVVPDRPREAVWDFLTSETNDVNWRGPWVRSVRRPSDGPVQRQRVQHAAALRAAEPPA